MSRLVIFDFDGTLTDAEQEGLPFRDGYLEDLALLADIEREQAFALAERFEAEVAGMADAFGWNFNGRIVAPAGVDPYLRMMPVARKIFDHAGVFLDLEQRDRLLDRILYKYNYGKSATVFRDGARERRQDDAK